VTVPEVAADVITSNTIAYRLPVDMAPPTIQPGSFITLPNDPPAQPRPYREPDAPTLAPTPLRDFLTARLAELDQYTGGPLVAAARAVMDHHAPAGVLLPDTTYQPDRCVGCGEEGYMQDPVAEHTDDCATLRALAAPFAEHDDYPPHHRPY
jgi:hypothetical protein